MSSVVAWMMWRPPTTGSSLAVSSTTRRVERRDGEGTVYEDNRWRLPSTMPLPASPTPYLPLPIRASPSFQEWGIFDFVYKK
jgi:hypothetical protein